MAEKRLTREQARELYDDLNKAMTQMMAKQGKTVAPMAESGGGTANSKVAKEIADAIKAGLNGKAPAQGSPRMSSEATRSPMRSAHPRRVAGAARKLGGTGQMAAILMISACCMAKVTLAALAFTGATEIEPAQASVHIPIRPTGPEWTKEEAKLLMQLDHRRAEIEERSSRIDQREDEFNARDRDLAVKLTELKDLTERLKLEREKGEKQRNTQLDQLANVYGSMNPPEAAHLLEQLDIQVALSLIERMPEKRIGQILALINAPRALELTNLLSKRGVR